MRNLLDQLGSTARNAVAEVGSGRKRNSTSAGSLHSVHFRAPRLGRAKRPNHRTKNHLSQLLKTSKLTKQK